MFILPNIYFTELYSTNQSPNVNPRSVFCIFGLLSYRYNIYQVRIEIWKLAPYSAGKCLRGRCPSMQMSGTRASYTLKRCFCYIYLFNIRWISCGTLRRLWDLRLGQWTPLACSGRKGFNLNACIFVQDYHQYLLNVSFVVANVDPLRKGKIPQPRRLGSLIKILGPLYVLLHVLYKLFYLGRKRRHLVSQI